jgi:hypothetical protein
VKGAVLALLMLISAGCAAAAGDGGLRDPCAFQSRFGYVALLPLRIGLPLESAEQVAHRIEEDLAAALAAAGFRVLPVAISRGIRERMEVESGGLSDPARFRVIDDYSARELLGDYPIDALVRPSLVPVAARVHNTRAMWDGTSEKLMTLGDRLLALRGLDGSVQALSLQLVIEGRDGRRLYARRGGIRLLARLGPDLQEIERVPEDELWRDPSALSRAIAYTLAPLRAAR